MRAITLYRASVGQDLNDIFYKNVVFSHSNFHNDGFVETSSGSNDLKMDLNIFVSSLKHLPKVTCTDPCIVKDVNPFALTHVAQGIVLQTKLAPEDLLC
jgi:hypothetical protein